MLLLLIVLGSAAGASIWLTLATDRAADPGDAAGRRVQVRLDQATAPQPAVSEPGASATAKAEPTPTTPPPTAVETPPAKAVDTPTAPGPPATPQSAPAEKPAKLAARPRPPEPESPVPAQPLPTGLTLPRIATGPPLSIAPDPALVRRGEHGLLPIIGGDGRRPWQVYARPFDSADKRPRIAIVVTGLGHSGAGDQSAVQSLPGPVTLAFSPYSRHLGERIPLARAAGHEILIHVPMEPIDYPRDDPGQMTLLTSLSESDNRQRLLWALGRATGYVGVVSHKGSRFTTDNRLMRQVLAELNKRGLLFVDSRTSARSATAEIATSIGLPWSIGSRRIDGQKSRIHIDARLSELEAVARKSGHAVGIGSISPVTIERIAAWVNGAERRGFVLAPISAVVDVDGRG